MATNINVNEQSISRKRSRVWRSVYCSHCDQVVSKSTFHRHRAVVHSQKQQSLAGVDPSMDSNAKERYLFFFYMHSYKSFDYSCYLLYVFLNMATNINVNEQSISRKRSRVWRSVYCSHCDQVVSKSTFHRHRAVVHF